MALNNDFKVKNRLFATGGGFFTNNTTGGVSYSIATSGNILSAGINLLDLFAPFTGGTVANNVYSTVNANSANWSSAYTNVNTNSANWNANYTTTFANSANWGSAYTNVNANSANWNTTYNTVQTNQSNWTFAYTQVNSGYLNWNANYTTTFANSANWGSAYTNVNTNSANWNSVYSTYKANSATYGTVTGVTNNGATQGAIQVTTAAAGNFPFTLNNLGETGDPTFRNLTVTNNLSVLGDFTFLNTSVSVTSALSVVNFNTGPALTVRQGGTTAAASIAHFIDAEGTGEIIFANNGFVSMGTGLFNPSERLTVGGNISATQVIYASGGNSDRWNSAYTYVNTNSANAIFNGGQSGVVTIGTNDANILNFETNSINRLSIAAGGNVGIGLLAVAPNEKLTVLGNISASGGAVLSGARLTGIAQTLVTTGNRIVTVETDGTLTFDALANGESIIGGIGLASNKLVKSTNNPNILSAGSITDTVSGVAIDRNVPLIIGAGIGAGGSANDFYVVDQVFFTPVLSAGSSVSTLLTAIPSTLATVNTTVRLMKIKYSVLLYGDSSPTYGANGANANRTAFEVLATVGESGGTSTTAGTVYAIVDNSTVPLLREVDMSIVNTAGRTSAVLTISSTQTCVGFIEARGYYGPYTTSGSLV